MRGMIRFTSALVAIAVAVVFLCCCNNNINVYPGSDSLSSSDTSGTTKVHDSFTLPYNSGKLLNPFKTDSFLNISLSQIIAESLTLSGVDGSAEYVLAESVTSENGNTVYTVKLRENIFFSDSTPLTADDVVKSAEQVILNTDSYFHGRLKNVSTVTAQDDSTVIFTLLSPDPCFDKMLSFPIIKDGSTDEDFIGTGSYILSEDEDGRVKLAANKVWHGGDIACDIINLAGTTNASELHYMLQTGQIDYYYTTDASKTSGSFSGTECETDITGFLAFNTKTGLMSDVNIRMCLSKTLNRQLLIDTCDVFAVPSVLQTVSADEKMTDLSEIIIQLGYDRIDDEGYRYKRSSGKNVYAELNVSYISTDNEADAIVAYIAEQLTAVGIKVNVTSHNSYGSILSASLKSRIDIIYSEVNMLPNSDISFLIEPTEGLAAALGQGDALWLRYNDYLIGNISEEKFNRELDALVPFTVLYKRKAKMIYNRLFAEGMEISPDMAYYGVYKWYIYE